MFNLAIARKNSDFHKHVIARSRAAGGRRSNPIRNSGAVVNAMVLIGLLRCSPLARCLAMTTVWKMSIAMTIVLLSTQPATAATLCVFNNPSLQCLRAARDVFSVPIGDGTWQHQAGQGGLNVTGSFDGGTWRWNFTGGSIVGRHWCANNAGTANGQACWCQITRLNGMSCLNAWFRMTTDAWYTSETHCINQCAADCSNNLRLFSYTRQQLINLTCVACDDCATECGAGWTAAPANTEMYTTRTGDCPDRPRGSATVTCSGP